MRSPQAAALHDLLVGPNISITTVCRGVLEVSGLSADQIGNLAADARLVLHELTPQQPSLEEAFMALTRDAVEYTATAARAPLAGAEGKAA